jgi:D-alanine-D-alanine ligase
MSTPRRIVVLFGGRSAEHEVSLLSARNVFLALDRARFEPVLVGIDRQGGWHLEPESTLTGAVGDPRAVHLDGGAPPVEPSRVLRPDDVVFPVLHGTYGEDGTIQGLLELAGVAYVGAGVLGSAIGMDKDVAKRLLRDAGIPVVDFQVVTAHRWRQAPRDDLAGAEALGFPLFCKPANAGSSVGVSRVGAPAELAAALATAFAFDPKALLERAVDAREVECAVLGNEAPEASVPGEISLAARHGFYSYDAKYVDVGGAEFRVPAALSVDTAAEVRRLAIATFRALELSGLARVDFFLERPTARLFVNEVNTMPGFTALSGYPKMWEASGLPVGALVSRLIELAVEKNSARRALSLEPGLKKV